MVYVPFAAEPNVYRTVHRPLAPVAVRVQVPPPVTPLPPVTENTTDPVGARDEPERAGATVAAQVVDAPSATVPGEHDRPSVVGALLARITTNAAAEPAPPCAPSPA